MNRHGRFREMLARRVELTATEEAGLRDHLERCQDCSWTAQRYEAQDALLTSLARVRPPTGLRTAVLSSVDQLATTPPRRPWAGGRGAALVAAVMLLLLLVGRALFTGTFQHGTSETARVLAAKGYQLTTPQGNVTVSRQAAVRLALALFPGQVQGSELAAVRNKRTPAFRGQNRLCWIVSIVPASGTGLVTSADPWLDGTSAKRGEMARVRYFLVFVDARTGAFVLASGADTA